MLWSALAGRCYGCTAVQRCQLSCVVRVGTECECGCRGWLGVAAAALPWCCATAPPAKHWCWLSDGVLKCDPLSVPAWLQPSGGERHLKLVPGACTILSTLPAPPGTARSGNIHTALIHTPYTCITVASAGSMCGCDAGHWRACCSLCVHFGGLAVQRHICCP
jgi:hypothetical protein